MYQLLHFEAYVNPKKRRQATGISNKHRYQVDCFNDVLDWLVQELDGRFSETSSNLLVWSAALSPRDSFHDFNLESLINLAKLYPQDFNSRELRDLDKDLRLYTANVSTDDSFSQIETITELSKKLVETRRHLIYPLFYRLLKLVIVLPVATATVERCFSAINWWQLFCATASMMIAWVMMLCVMWRKKKWRKSPMIKWLSISWLWRIRCTY